MTTAYWRHKERLYLFCGLESGLETGSCFNPSQLQPAHRATELQEPSLQLRKASKERASEPRGTKI